jgi:hypothetical protein
VVNYSSTVKNRLYKNELGNAYIESD